MSDLISRADAIEAVRQLRDTDGDVWGEALDTLTALPSAVAIDGDLISRADARKAFTRINDLRTLSLGKVGEVLDSLPSADAVPIQEVKLKDGFKIDDIDENYKPKIVGNAKFVRSKCEVTDLISRADAIEAACNEMDWLDDGGVEERKTMIKDALSALPSAYTVPGEWYEDAVKANHVLVKENSELKTQSESASDAYMRGFDDCKRAYEIELARSADAVQGEWIFNTDENNGKSWNICSVCGYSIFHKANYCPNCGAKMKGGADD